MSASSRKGAARIADIPPEILSGLNAGRLEAATLVENLGTDFSCLLGAVFPDLRQEAARIDPKDGITKRMAAAARILLAAHGAEQVDVLAAHPSDLVRGWGAYLWAGLPDLTIEARIAGMRRFADDPHFGVREWAWLSMRPTIGADPLAAIGCLQGWATDPSANIRRFAVEATRPRGVWSPHIALLKRDPAQGLPLLTPVKADPARYVQDSVANWLNDAWKSAPDWVERLCETWASGPASDATGYIVKRALRNRK